jgi:signal transduction histidine kinase
MILIPVAILELILGFFILFKDRKSRVHRSFFGITICLAFWSFSSYMSWKSKAPILNFWDNMLYCGPSLLASFFVYFALSFPAKKKIYKKQYLLIFGPSIILCIAAFFRLIIKTSFTPSNYIPGFGLPIFNVYFLIYMLFSFLILFKNLKNLTGLQKLQINYVFAGTFIATTVGSLFNLFLPMMQISELTELGPSLSGPILVVFIAYAILRYRLMDINVVLTRAGIFMVVYAFILGIPFIIGWKGRELFVEKFGVAGWWLVPTSIMAGLASVGPYLYNRLRYRAEEALLQEQRRYQETLRQASRGMILIKELNKLLNLIVHIITKSVRVSHAGIYLYDSDRDAYVLKSWRDKHRKQDYDVIHKDSILVEYLMRIRKSVLAEEVQSRQGIPEGLGNFLKQMMATLIVPAFAKDHLVGFLLLGDKLSGRVYTNDDITVFEVLTSQAALAIENALFYEETGKSLAQQFHEHRLRSVGKMGSGVGHQINNRFNVISVKAEITLLDTIEKLKTNKNLSEEIAACVNEVESTLNTIIEEAQRGGTIATTLTRFSRKQESYKALSLKEVVDGTLNLLSCKFSLAELNVSLSIPENLPLIYGNLAQLQDIFFNLLDNAHDALLKKKEEINAGRLDETASSPYVEIRATPFSSEVQVTIEDNGIGMAEHQVDQLFIPFFTTKATSEKGTGLGLSIIKRIIDAHSGRINCTSTYGKGTSFIITLPAAKESQIEGDIKPVKNAT